MCEFSSLSTVDWLSSTVARADAINQWLPCHSCSGHATCHFFIRQSICGGNAGIGLQRRSTPEWRRFALYAYPERPHGGGQEEIEYRKRVSIHDARLLQCLPSAQPRAPLWARSRAPLLTNDRPARPRDPALACYSDKLWPMLCSAEAKDRLCRAPLRLSRA